MEGPLEVRTLVQSGLRSKVWSESGGGGEEAEGKREVVKADSIVEGE